MQKCYQEELFMKGKIETIIEAGCLEIEFKFIEFEHKMLNIEYELISISPFFSYEEKKEMIDEAYLKAKSYLLL